MGNALIDYNNRISIVTDKNKIPNSAAYFNEGYMQLSPGVYLPGDFTVSAWIRNYEYSLVPRLIDFSNGEKIKW